MSPSERRPDARACLLAGVEAAHPESVVPAAIESDAERLRVEDVSLPRDDIDRTVVLGGGNAAGTAASALEGVLGDTIDEGVVVTDDPSPTERIEVVEGTHPLPSEANVAGTRKVLDAAERAGNDDVVLAVIAGGGSALLCAPAGNVTLSDLRSVTDELLRAGAAIEELNAVRKHCSAIKGGRLAAAAAPATVVGLVFSDVIGNPLDVIASGPTAPDTTTYQDALDALERYDVDAPVRVREHLEAGVRGEHPETPTADDEAFARVSNRVLADADTALTAAAEEAGKRGYETEVLTSRVRGEAKEAAKTHVALGEESVATGRPLEPPAALLTGGETTVTVRGDGSGGPNLEFALSAAIELDHSAVTVGSIDTDGYDGGTEIAGAIVDGDTLTREAEGAARDALAENDAGGFFAGHEAELDTGATGTNVNDLRVVLVGEPE